MKVSIIFKKMPDFIAAAFSAVAYITIANALPVDAAVRSVYVGDDFYPPVADLSTTNKVSGTVSSAAISRFYFPRSNGGSGVVNNGNNFKFNGLTVYAPTKLLTRLARAAHGWNINFFATPCLTYRVQRAAQISGPWSDLGKVFAPFNQVSFTASNAPAGNAFYRTVTL